MSGDGVQTSYAELIEVLENLPLLVRETRRRLGQSQRAAAVDAGTQFSTISRVENGAGLHIESAVALLRWIGKPPVVADGVDRTESEGEQG